MVVVIVILLAFLVWYVLLPSQSVQAPIAQVQTPPTATTQAPADLGQPTQQSPTQNTQAQNPPEPVVDEFTREGLTRPSNSFDLADGKGTKLNTYNILATTKGFSISEIIVREGSMAQLNITNKAGVPIDVSSQELGLQTPSIAPEATINMSVSVNAIGTFDLMCNKACPQGTKLLGKLTVK